MHRYLIITLVIFLLLPFVSYSEPQETTPRDKAVYCEGCREQCVSSEVKLAYPLQGEFNTNGYFLLLGVFASIFILIRIISFFNKDDINKIGYATTAFLSLGAVIIFAVMFESWMYHTYYISLLSIQPMVLINLLIFVWILFGIGTFFYKVVWSFLNFHEKGEMSDFLWWIIRTAEQIKRDTRL